MCWALRFGFGTGVVPINAFQVCFEIITRFPRWKSDNISPYFRGGNLAMLYLRSVIACQMLFSPSFRCENAAMGMPYFHDENLAKFHVWCTSRVSRIQSISMCLHYGKQKPSKVLDHTDMCHIHRETNVTWCHGSRQSYCNDRAHNMAWICTYSNRLEHIPTLQVHNHPYTHYPTVG